MAKGGCSGGVVVLSAQTPCFRIRTPAALMEGEGGAGRGTQTGWVSRNWGLSVPRPGDQDSRARAPATFRKITSEGPQHRGKEDPQEERGTHRRKGQRMGGFLEKLEMREPINVGGNRKEGRRDGQKELAE